MKRNIVLAIGILVLAMVVCFWWARQARYRRIATALLVLHHDWATNDYKPTENPVPRLLREQGEVYGDAVGQLGAYVQYIHQKDGVDWKRRLHILRTNMTTTTWTLYEFDEPADTNLLKLAWKRKLITVSGEP